MRIPIALAIAVALVTSACSRRDEREYTLQGQVLSVAADRVHATIKHENIAGLMPAMTMTYSAEDGQQFANLKPGDLINATLVVVTNGAFLRDVKKVGEAPLEKMPDAPLITASGAEVLRAGEAVPNAQFVDQDGKKRDVASFKNSTLVITFIYTRCPIPTFCPLMDRHFVSIQRRLQADPALKNVHLVSVTFDPATDTPAVLKQHAASLGADPKYWTFLTGDRGEIDRFAERFGLVASPEPDASITHNLRTAIIDSRGMVVKTYTGGDWTPEEILADLKTVASSD
jgi:protein SCO1/2